MARLFQRLILTPNRLAVANRDFGVRVMGWHPPRIRAGEPRVALDRRRPRLPRFGASKHLRSCAARRRSVADRGLRAEAG